MSAGQRGSKDAREGAMSRALERTGAAINDAAKKVDQLSQEKMGSLAGGMGLPPGFKMPF